MFIYFVSFRQELLWNLKFHFCLWFVKPFLVFLYSLTILIFPVLFSIFLQLILRVHFEISYILTQISSSFFSANAKANNIGKIFILDSTTWLVLPNNLILVNFLFKGWLQISNEIIEQLIASFGILITFTQIHLEHVLQFLILRIYILYIHNLIFRFFFKIFIILTIKPLLSFYYFCFYFQSFPVFK